MFLGYQAHDVLWGCTALSANPKRACGLLFCASCMQALSDHGRQAPRDATANQYYSFWYSGCKRTKRHRAMLARIAIIEDQAPPGHTWQSPQRLETHMARWRSKPAWPNQRLTAQIETQGNWCPGNPILERGTVPLQTRLLHGIPTRYQAQCTHTHTHTRSCDWETTEKRLTTANLDRANLSRHHMAVAQNKVFKLFSWRSEPA